MPNFANARTFGKVGCKDISTALTHVMSCSVGCVISVLILLVRQLQHVTGLQRPLRLDTPLDGGSNNARGNDCKQFRSGPPCFEKNLNGKIVRLTGKNFCQPVNCNRKLKIMSRRFNAFADHQITGKKLLFHKFNGKTCGS